MTELFACPRPNCHRVSTRLVEVEWGRGLDAFQGWICETCLAELRAEAETLRYGSTMDLAWGVTETGRVKGTPSQRLEAAA